jgi:hypothetical protein
MGAHEAVGKVTGLVYDHFGDFEGFLLEVGCDRTRRFRSRERRVECLIREAWRERSTVVVIAAAHDAQSPANIVVGGRTGCDCC